MFSEEALCSLETANTVGDAVNRIALLAGDFDVASFSYVDTGSVVDCSSAEPYFETTVRSDFISSYVSSGFLDVDPVVRRSWAGQNPFSWYDCPEFSGSRTKTTGRRNSAGQILDLAADHGFKNGIIVPLHHQGANGQRSCAFVSLYFEDELSLSALRQRFPPTLRLASIYFHERMTELRGAGPVTTDTSELNDVMLTDREREALIWASRGKTNSETAQIMNVSNATVAFFMSAAQKKLGVYNKTHAVARALVNGLIVP